MSRSALDVVDQPKSNLEITTFGSPLPLSCMSLLLREVDLIATVKASHLNCERFTCQSRSLKQNSTVQHSAHKFEDKHVSGANDAPSLCIRRSMIRQLLRTAIAGMNFSQYLDP